MGKLLQLMQALAVQSGGSHKTVHDRVALVQRFDRHLQVLNIQNKEVKQLKARHIEGYIQHRLAQGIARRTLHNEMAALRAVLIAAGRNKLADDPRLSNKALGLAGASRAGTKQAITVDHYQTVLQTAQLKEPGLTAALELARLLGLRSQEAVQCAQSLKTWRQVLDRGDERLRIVFGTKGGRPRDTVILNADAVKRAMENALTVAEQRNGKLIDAPDLKTAMTYWRNQAERLGLTGVYAPHSLRYAWAQDAIRHYLVQGFSHKEALAQVSMDLGHGDGRGRYVARVYGQMQE